MNNYSPMFSICGYSAFRHHVWMVVDSHLGGMNRTFWTPFLGRLGNTVSVMGFIMHICLVQKATILFLEQLSQKITDFYHVSGCQLLI